MYFKKSYLFPLVLLFFISCSSDKTNDTAGGITWSQPEAGTSVQLGEKVTVKLNVDNTDGLDSVVYFVDGIRQIRKADTAQSFIETGNLLLGNRLITAKVFRKGQPEEEVSTNIVLKSNLVPEKFSYKVVQVFDHDTSSYTQGLEYHKGFFYESDGGNTPETGYSSLRKVEPSTGKVIQRVDLPQDIFAEGITIVGDKIIQLTWQNKIGLVYDLNTFKRISEFPYQNSDQGWGLCSDDKKLYKSDGSNLIYFLNRDNYREEGYIEVYDQNGPVDQLNELEFIDGKIYANVYNSNRIVMINPANGQVTGEVDMSDLLPAIYNYQGTDVLNGIAWDSQGKRLFLTGKRWAKLFQVVLFPSTEAARP